MHALNLAVPNAPATPFYIGQALLSRISPGARRGLSILIYHRVLAKKDPLFPAELDATEFDNQIRILNSCFNIIPLIDAVRHARAGTLPPRAACITFDDGYADNAEIALPILKKHGVNATFFVATGFIDGGRMWNDTVIELVRRSDASTIDASSIGLGVHPIASLKQKQAAIPALIGRLKYLSFAERAARVDALCKLVQTPLPTNLMMTSAQVLDLHGEGMGIGGHTVLHPILARLKPADAKDEIRRGKEALEKIIAEPVRLFAYPNGKPGADYAAEHVAMVKELGFEGAVSTSWGSQNKRSDLFQLPRFTPWDQSRFRFVLRLAKNLLTDANQT